MDIIFSHILVNKLIYFNVIFLNLLQTFLLNTFGSMIGVMLQIW